MNWILALAGAWMVHASMPPDVHGRMLRIVGRRELAPDERLLAWWQARATRSPGQPRTTLLVQMLVAELAAGMLTADAFAHVLGAAYTSPDALDEQPPTVDVRVWRDVARIWRASDEAGFSMAGALQRIQTNALVDQEVAREVQSTAAAPRFALVTVMALPLAMWWIGSGMGADPVGFLLHNPIGWGCLFIGLSLFIAAALWMRALTKRAVA